jgi:hypothetical protein
MVLIYSKDVDDFVNEVIDFLDVDFIRIGENDKILIENLRINNEITFRIKGDYFSSFNIQELESVWFNGGYASTIGDEYENECYRMLTNSFLSYNFIKKIGRIRSYFEINKLDALIEAEKQGFKIPDTLITGSKEKLLAFYNNYLKEGIICKGITDRVFYKDNDYVYNLNLTFKICINIMNSIPEHFVISLFQEKINADFEIRVVLVGDVFYAMSIHVFDDEVDYRAKLTSMDNIRLVRFRLPNNIQKKLKKVFKKFNLNYGSADLMYRNGEYYFLEINPTGQISFVNNACNFYIQEQLSNMLTNEK